MTNPQIEHRDSNGNSRRELFSAGGAILALALVSTACAPAETAASNTASTGTSDGAVVLKAAMRKLWEDHITYTRNVIISALAGLPDQAAVTQRLLRNQDDIGAAIGPYYGDTAASQLSKLLRDHIMIAAEVVGAAKAGNKSDLAAKQQQWSDNGRAIAAFLSTANPNLAKTQLEEMLQMHLDLTTGEVVGRLSSDWEADIRSYDEGHEHMLKFADALSDGIIKQFPAKFT